MDGICYAYSRGCISHPSTAVFDVTAFHPMNVFALVSPLETDNVIACSVASPTEEYDSLKTQMIIHK
jgi:hypothetical protein